MNNITPPRLIEKDDFNKGYIELLQEFANFKTPITESYFTSYIEKTHNFVRIYVIEDKTTNKIIGAGSLFILPKLHIGVNKIGTIEDIIVNTDYRGKGLGKLLVNKLAEVGKDMNCYKVMLNCKPHTEEFYKKSGFIRQGFVLDKR